MKKTLKLNDSWGRAVFIRLDNWGSGTDKANRRWMLESDGWRCAETGAIARPATRVTTLFTKGRSLSFPKAL